VVYKHWGKDIESYLILLKFKSLSKSKKLNTKVFFKPLLSKEIFLKHLVMALIKFSKDIDKIIFQKNVKKSFDSDFIENIVYLIRKNSKNIKNMILLETI